MTNEELIRLGRKQSYLKLSQKRTCNGCRALKNGWISCRLGYQTGYRSEQGHAVEGIPLEECPKPKTWDEFYEAQDYFTKEQ